MLPSSAQQPPPTTQATQYVHAEKNGKHFQLPCDAWGRIINWLDSSSAASTAELKECNRIEAVPYSPPFSGMVTAIEVHHNAEKERVGGGKHLSNKAWGHVKRHLESNRRAFLIPDGVSFKLRKYPPQSAEADDADGGHCASEADTVTQSTLTSAWPPPPPSFVDRNETATLPPTHPHHPHPLPANPNPFSHPVHTQPGHPPPHTHTHQYGYASESTQIHHNDHQTTNRGVGSPMNHQRSVQQPTTEGQGQGQQQQQQASAAGPMRGGSRLMTRAQNRFDPLQQQQQQQQQQGNSFVSRDVGR